ncbi:MAG: oligosaccharide flippase family protein [Desulfobulbaceae bacterium]|nr:oligosaccharide flippase family protein [Desulfobulbaceae bacterium]
MSAEDVETIEICKPTESVSLTKQAGQLMAGRLLALPLTFFVPMVLVRTFSIEEFGYYKQLFLIFYVILPVIDLGISNSLFYFIPKFPESKSQILSQTISLQLLICAGVAISFAVFKQEISLFFGGSSQNLTSYIPLLGMVAVSWHFSNMLETLLIVEKKAFQAATVSFLSDAMRSIATIAMALAGGKLETVLLAILATGVLRTFAVGWYLKKTMRFSFTFEAKALRSQLDYALPFGLAVVINTLVQSSHQYIVSISANVTDFALYSVGCFQLPILAIIVDSVAKASLVKMSEISGTENSSAVIAELIKNSLRKLWILFFPIFVFLFITAEEFITLLFTDTYLGAVPVFRIFILMIPLSTILVQHVPRAFTETRFILINNLVTLLLSVGFCIFLLAKAGLAGAAAGYILANLIWRLFFIFKCKRLLRLPISSLFPSQAMAEVAIFVGMIGGVSFFIKQAFFDAPLPSFLFTFVLYGVACMGLYWLSPILLPKEKMLIRDYVRKIARRFLSQKTA